MKTQIIITEQKITKAGEIRLFQIPLPKNTTRVISIGSDVRIQTEFNSIGVQDAGVGIGVGVGVGGGYVIGGGLDEVQWDLTQNKLAGNLIIQSMEKANIFFYEEVWTIAYDDGITNLESVESMNAFTVLKKTEPKKVDIPSGTTILNCLYNDAIGADNDTDVIYRVKVLVWIECNNE
mgnify:CR=1 FL=1